MSPFADFAGSTLGPLLAAQRRMALCLRSTPSRLQDALKVSQQRPGAFETPNWDEASLKKVRAALLQLGETISDTRRMFGAKDQVDPVRHLVGTALLWGANPEKDALYLPVTPAWNDGATLYRLTVRDVPVDGFWSISLYNTEG